MTDSGVIFNLDDLKNAIPKFQAAVDEINQVLSTVNHALNGLDSIPGGRGAYVSDNFVNQLQFITDRLKSAAEDYEEVINLPVDGGPGGIGWKPGEGGDTDPDTDDPGTPWPEGKPGKKPDKKDKDKHDDDDGGSGHGSQGGSPTSSGQQDQDDPNTPQGEPGSGNQQQGQQNGGPGSQPGGTGPSGNQDQTGAGGIPLIPGMPGPNAKRDEEEDEEDEFQPPEYVSAANKHLLDQLNQKEQLLEETEARLLGMADARAEKAEILGRLQAAVAGKSDPLLEEQIEKLKKEITDMDIELYNADTLLPGLREDIDVLQKRLELVAVGPDADIDAIRALEGGETSQWIRDATRNEDNSVNCVNYIVNRMAIPGELPLNAHLWDEQATKFADKYGIRISDVPMEGSVIVMEREHSYAHDIYGHVMYVEKVEDGIVWVTDNNYPDRMVRLDHLTTELSGPYIKYLYFPWQTVV